MSELEEIRKHMQKTDEGIVRLLQERAALAKKIGEIKASLDLPVYDPAQETKVFHHLLEINGNNFPEKALQAIFREIISASRALQQPLVVACLGPEASFTHLAAQQHFGLSTTFSCQPTIHQVFDAAAKGRAAFGVVPIENSLEGSVNLTLDGLVATNLKIRAEIYLPISHCLLSAGEDLQGLRKVYSHPQALAQCQGWLRLHVPQCELIGVESTAKAAQLVAGVVQWAAIGSRLAADAYGLNILAESIEDNENNTTRFLVIGQGETEPTGRDKTSIIFSTGHVPGSLHRALTPFAKRGINLLKIESFPMKNRLWEYFFFVDLAGHHKTKEVEESLRELKENSAFLKILGSYPQGEVTT